MTYPADFSPYSSSRSRHWVASPCSHLAKREISLLDHGSNETDVRNLTSLMNHVHTNSCHPVVYIYRTRMLKGGSQ